MVSKKYTCQIIDEKGLTVESFALEEFSRKPQMVKKIMTFFIDRKYVTPKQIIRYIMKRGASSWDVTNWALCQDRKSDQERRKNADWGKAECLRTKRD